MAFLAIAGFGAWIAHNSGAAVQNPRALQASVNLQRSWSVCFCSSLGIDGSLVNAGPGVTAKINAATKPAAVACTRHRRISPVIRVYAQIGRCQGRSARRSRPIDPVCRADSVGWRFRSRKTGICGWSTPGSDAAKVVLLGEVLKLRWRGPTLPLCAYRPAQAKLCPQHKANYDLHLTPAQRQIREIGGAVAYHCGPKPLGSPGDLIPWPP
jgi:hypothetical protein